MPAGKCANLRAASTDFLNNTPESPTIIAYARDDDAHYGFTMNDDNEYGFTVDFDDDVELYGPKTDPKKTSLPTRYTEGRTTPCLKDSHKGQYSSFELIHKCGCHFHTTQNRIRFQKLPDTCPCAECKEARLRKYEREEARVHDVFNHKEAIAEALTATTRTTVARSRNARNPAVVTVRGTPVPAAPLTLDIFKLFT